MKERHISIIIFYTKEGNILLQKRDTHLKYDWGYFGGGINKGETPEQALVREIKEELTFTLDTFQKIGYFICHPEGKLTAYIHLFVSPMPLTDTFEQTEGIGRKIFSLEEAKKLSISPGKDFLALDIFELWYNKK